MTRVLWIALALIAVACTDDVDPNQDVDVHVVVQETNQPCPPECAMCEPGEVRYDMEVTRSCSPLMATVSICAAADVCQEQLDVVFDLVRECMEESSEFDLVITDCPAPE